MSKKKLSYESYQLVSMPIISEMLDCSNVIVNYKQILYLLPKSSSITYGYNEQLKKTLGLPYLNVVASVIADLSFLQIEDRQYFDYKINARELTFDEISLSEDILLYLYLFNPKRTISMFDSDTFVNYSKQHIVISERHMRLLACWRYIALACDNPIITDETRSRFDEITSVGQKLII